MKKLRILVEEHLCKAIDIEVPDDTDLTSDIVEQKENEVRTKYQNGEIVLAADDYNGTTLVCTQLIGGDNVIEETGWNNI